MIPHVLSHASFFRASSTDWMGYTAAALVLATFSVTSMRILRCLAILSNIAFIAYGAATGLLPILILHSVLLPTNMVRLLQLESQRRLRPPAPRAFAGVQPERRAS